MKSRDKIGNSQGGELLLAIRIGPLSGFHRMSEHPNTLVFMVLISHDVIYLFCLNHGDMLITLINSAVVEIACIANLCAKHQL